MATIFAEVCKQPVRVNENGVWREITKLQAGITQLANKAASGDVRAIGEILKWNQILEERIEMDGPALLQHERENALMANLVERIRRTEPSTTQAVAEPKTEDAK